LALQACVVPRQPIAPGDDEQRIRHEPHHALDEPFEIAMRTVADVLEGVHQDDRRRAMLAGQPVEVPGKEVRIVAECLQVRLRFQ
jgi:hypothetical protein